MAAPLRTLLINLASVLGVLAVLEIGVRTLGPSIPPVGTDRLLIADSVYGASPGLRPGAAGYSNGAWFEVGSRGFLSYSKPVSDGTPGWLFLGDSVTMGLGVDPDSTFAGRLATRLDGIDIWNPSLIGYAVEDYHRVFDALIGDDDLARVTLFWCLNDLYSIGGGDPGSRIRLAGGRLLRAVQRHYRTYHLVKALALDRPLSYFEHVDSLYEEQGRLVDEAAGRIRLMEQAAESAGVRFEVVVLPFEAQLRSGGRTRPQEILRRALAPDSIAVLDPIAHLAASTGSPTGLYLYGDGIHFSRKGHAVLADFVLERLGPVERR